MLVYQRVTNKTWRHGGFHKWGDPRLVHCIEHPMKLDGTGNFTGVPPWIGNLQPTLSNSTCLRMVYTLWCFNMTMDTIGKSPSTHQLAIVMGNTMIARHIVFCAPSSAKPHSKNLGFQTSPVLKFRILTLYN